MGECVATGWASNTWSSMLMPMAKTMPRVGGLPLSGRVPITPSEAPHLPAGAMPAARGLQLACRAARVRRENNFLLRRGRTGWKEEGRTAGVEHYRMKCRPEGVPSYQKT